MCKRERTDGIVGHPLAAEVAPITLEVGGQGKLGRQVRVPDAKGVLFELVWNVSRLPLFFRAFESDYHDWIGEPYVFVIPLCRCRHDCRCSEWPNAEGGDLGRGRNIHTQR